jgi:predicted lipoprotein with Yx(FWY)xxD motif
MRFGTLAAGIAIIGSLLAAGAQAQRSEPTNDPNTKPPEIAVPAGVTFQRIKDGFVLADYRGLTMYASDADTAAKPACTAACLQQWPVVPASMMANAVGDWSVMVRADGLRQWAFKGKPVYTHVKDIKPGEAAGDGRDSIWHALKP